MYLYCLENFIVQFFERKITYRETNNHKNIVIFLGKVVFLLGLATMFYIDVLVIYLVFVFKIKLILFKKKSIRVLNIH